MVNNDTVVNDMAGMTRNIMNEHTQGYTSKGRGQHYGIVQGSVHG